MPAHRAESTPSPWPRPQAWWTAGLLILALGGLAGCATPAPDANVPALQQPEANQPHARMLLRATVPPDHRYLVVVLQDNLQCTGPQVLTRGTTQQAASPARLPVGQLVTMDLVITNAATSKSCVTRWSFTPQAGKTYLVQAAVLGTQCPARLLDATTPDRAMPPPDLLGRVGPGNNCLPLDKSAKVTQSLIQGGQHNGDAVLQPNATTRDLEGLIKP